MHKKIIFLIFLLIPHTCFADIIISEIYPNPIGKERGHEWVELHNTSPEAQKLDDLLLNSTQLQGWIPPLGHRTFILPLKNARNTITLSNGNTLTYDDPPEGLSLIREPRIWTTPSPNNPNPKFTTTTNKVSELNIPNINPLLTQALSNKTATALTLNGTTHSFKIQNTINNKTKKQLPIAPLILIAALALSLHCRSFAQHQHE